MILHGIMINYIYNGVNDISIIQHVQYEWLIDKPGAPAVIKRRYVPRNGPDPLTVLLGTTSTGNRPN